MGTTTSQHLSSIASARGTARDTQHASYTPATPTPLSLELLALPATEQAKALQSSRITSYDLTLASIHRCHTVGFPLNAITHELYTTALASAKESDERRARGASRGDLDGLPMSIKDVFDMRGTDCTQGLAVRCNKVTPHDGLLIALLRHAGAVFVCRSNVPQCLMLPESANAIFGPSINPYDVARTPGGSSGGEGSLIASRCTALGLGSDIGGSIRIPAAFTGICGFKPTPERLTRRGMPAPKPTFIDGQLAILPVAGPLARSAGDLTLITRTLLSPLQWEGFGEVAGDPTVPRQPWSEASYQATRASSPTPLRLGYLSGGRDGFFALAPACARALEVAVAAARAAGHECIPFTPAEHGLDLRRACLLFYEMLGADGALYEFKRGLEGEALHDNYSVLNTLASIPNALRPVIGGVLKGVLGWTRAADLLMGARSRSTREYWELCREREEFKGRLIEAWQGAGIQALLCPAMGLPAFLHGQSRHLTPACSPCFLWNLVGFPAAVLPSGVTQGAAGGGGEDVYQAPLGQRGDVFFTESQKAVAGAAGMPVGFQVVGLPFEDEGVLGVCEVLEGALGYSTGGAPEATIQKTLAAIAAT